MSKSITEAEVSAAHSRGATIRIAPRQIVTPAARDLARKLGVAIEDAADNRTPATVALGADHGGFLLKEALKATVAELGYAVLDLGCDSTEAVDYPVYAARVAEAVATGKAALAIMVDGAGIGSAMVGNKIAGVRAALCYNTTTAHNAREHNNANMLTLGGGLIGANLARDIVKTFLATPFAGGRHLRRVSMIDALDGQSTA